MPSPAAAGIAWLEDYEIARERAAQLDRPLFVYFDAPWCSWCQLYERRTLGDEALARALAAGFVALKVNYDSRPDLFQRLGGKGLPYTAVLSAHGELRGGFTGVLEPADLVDLLVHYSASQTAAPRAAAPVARSTGHDAAAYRAFRDAWLRHVDSLYRADSGTLTGRFETGATLKRPSPLTWMYLNDHGLWRERSGRAARAEIERLLDRHHGGFFNFLDPSRPEGDYLESSKILEANAWLSAWLAQAGREEPVARRAAYLGWLFLRERLWDRERGGFYQAQSADTDYYALPPARRLRATPPGLDRIKRADTNAQAALALLRYARASGNAQAQDYAGRALDYVLVRLWRDGRLHHAEREGRSAVADLPTDWFWVLAAGRELEAIAPDAGRRARLTAIAETAAGWLERRMRDAHADELPVELLSLIAWLGGERAFYPMLPAGARDWALARLRIEPETAPDDLVYALWAWERGQIGGAEVRR